MSDAILVFVGHRFTPEFKEDFRAAVNNALSTFKGQLTPVYADETLINGHILGQKIEPMIDDCFFCIFDISDIRKPHVFIELGYAYGRGKHVVLTSDGGGNFTIDNFSFTAASSTPPPVAFLTAPTYGAGFFPKCGSPPPQKRGTEVCGG